MNASRARRAWPALLVVTMILVPSRAMGAVTASFSGGVLTITGDELANVVTVGLNVDDQYLVNGNTVDNGGSPTTVSDVNEISVDLGAGGDTLTLNFKAVPSLPLTINAGEGSDTVTLNLATQNGDVMLGANNDDVVVNGGGQLDYLGGGGTDLFTYQGGAGQDSGLFQTGKFTISGEEHQLDENFEKIVLNGRGNDDFFNIGDLPLNQMVTINGGAGDDFGGAGIEFGSGSMIAGDMFFNGGGGENVFISDSFFDPTTNEWILSQSDNGRIRFRGDELDARMERVHRIDAFLSGSRDVFTVNGPVNFPPPPNEGLSAPHGADGPPPPLTVLSGPGKDRVDVGSVKDQTALNLGDGADKAFGSAKRDRISGEGNNDILKGRDGNDSLDGGAGDDECYGQGGTDDFKDCEVKKQS